MLRHAHESAVAFLALTLAINSANATEGVTVKDYLLRMQLLSTEPLINHCRVNAPETAEAVQAGYKNYMSAFDIASKRWLLTLGPAASTMAPPSSEQFLKELPTQVLDGIKQYDPAKYCTWLANRLSSITPEGLQKILHDAYARYEAMGREQKSQPKAK